MSTLFKPIGVEPPNESVMPDLIADDDYLAPPEVTESMYFGLVGRVMKAASAGTEVHPAAAGMAFMTYAGAAFGRWRWLDVGDSRHHARIFACHVGPSGSAGKGMALGLPKRIREWVEMQPLAVSLDYEKPRAGHFHPGGLSTAEGLAWRIRDACDEPDSADSGVPDKRIFVIEEEFVNVMAQAKREGNTLSPAIRTTWDGGTLAPLTKTNRVVATDPHVCIYAAITPGELQSCLSEREKGNGFANRFLYLWAERQGIVPFPPRTPDGVVSSLADEFIASLRFAQAGGPISEDDAARNLFAAYYARCRKGAGWTQELRLMFERYPAYARRLALLFAIMDCRAEVAYEHMNAALAWLRYCEQSTRLVFSSGALERRADKCVGIAQQLLAIVRSAPGQKMTRTDAHYSLGKPEKSNLDEAVRQLIVSGELTEISTPRPGGGRPLRELVATHTPPKQFAQ